MQPGRALKLAPQKKEVLREHSLMLFMINILKSVSNEGSVGVVGGAREISAMQWSANKMSRQGD